MPPKKNYRDHQVGAETFALLDLDSQDVEKRVLAEMDAGVQVYYDTRWGATGIFSEWALAPENAKRFKGKNILILGAGIGLETLVLAKLGAHVWLNDLAPVALEMCVEQLEANGLTNYTVLVGKCEEVPLPETLDLAVACFFIYNKQTATATTAFLERFPKELIFVNENLDPFPKWLSGLDRKVTPIFEDGAARCVAIASGS